MGKRIVAFIIDIAIWSFLFSLAFRLLADSADKDFATCTGTCFTAGDTVYGVGGAKAALLWLIFFWGYLILVLGLLQGIKGFAAGKALLGLRVVNANGEAPGAGKGIVRALFLIIDYFFCLLIGLISSIATKKHQRVGDMVAKTFVVGKNDVGRPIGSPVMAADPYGTPVGAAAGAYGAPAAAAPYTPAAPPVTDAFAAAPPVAEPAAAPMAEPAAAPAPSGAEPQWDPARNAYIQWDAAQGSWLQFDDATQQWRPIDQ